MILVLRYHIYDIRQYRDMPRCSFLPCYKNSTEKVSLFKITESRYEAWRDIMPGLILNKYICMKHFRDEDIIKGWQSRGVFIPYITPKLKYTAMPLNNKIKDGMKSGAQYKRKQLRTNGIPNKIYTSKRPISKKQNKIKQKQENLNMCLDESEITIKEELESDEFDINYKPSIDENFKFKFTIQESDILSNFKTELSELDIKSVLDKDTLLVSVKAETSDTEAQSQSVLQPITTVLLSTIEPETIVGEEEEDPLKI